MCYSCLGSEWPEWPACGPSLQRRHQVDTNAQTGLTARALALLRQMIPTSATYSSMSASWAPRVRARNRFLGSSQIVGVLCLSPLPASPCSNMFCAFAAYSLQNVNSCLHAHFVHVFLLCVCVLHCLRSVAQDSSN